MVKPRRFFAVFRVCVFSLALSWTVSESHGQTLQIDKLKANYLVGFLDYARWQGQLKNDSATIAVIGDADLLVELEARVASLAGARTVTIERIELGASVNWDTVDIVFVGGGRSATWEGVKDECLGRAILLVGDGNDFLQQGGAIQFTFRRNRLRFYVDPENASAQGIELSSKLIELALEQP